MSDLSRLLKRAFENKGGKNIYKSGAYEIAFEKRAWETLFWVSYNAVPVLQGNTFDREVALCTSESVHPYKKLLNAVWETLPDYKIIGENYEHYMESDGQKRLLEAVYLAISVALRNGYDQLVLVDEDGTYSMTSADYDLVSSTVCAGERIVGKVECFYISGVRKAGFVEFEEPISLEDYKEKNGLCEDVGQLIDGAIERSAEDGESKFYKNDVVKEY